MIESLISTISAFLKKNSDRFIALIHNTEYYLFRKLAIKQTKHEYFEFWITTVLLFQQ